jgi:hypothetical protein
MCVHLFWVISSKRNEISSRGKNDILGGRLTLAELMYTLPFFCARL